MAKWLVTGGCGFIGSHLVDALLQRGDQVRVLDDLSSGKRENIPAGVELHIGDVADAHAVRECFNGIDGCFHLAAVASVQRCSMEWLETHRTNLQGTICVFEQARQVRPSAPLPVVYASSAAVYGDNAAIPLAETAATNPLSSYGADKLACELQARVAWHVHRIPNVGLRFFNVYGTRQDPSSPYSGVISIFTDRIVHNREVEVFGDGRQTRDFIYVRDVVAHLVAAMGELKAGARIFNVCTGTETSLLELIATIGKILGRQPIMRYGAARNGDIRVSVGDPSAAMAAYGLSGQASLVEGLSHLLGASRAKRHVGDL